MVYTPGQRISTRSEDFIINESIRDGENWILKVEGISELVKGQRFVFDTNIDKEIRISDPKTQSFSRIQTMDTENQIVY